MAGYFVAWFFGIPAGILLKMVLFRIIISVGWWAIGAIFFVLCVIWGMIPQKAKEVLKGVLIVAVISFCISCFF
jgi:hypothetical protein